MHDFTKRVFSVEIELTIKDAANEPDAVRKAVDYIRRNLTEGSDGLLMKVSECGCDGEIGSPNLFSTDGTNIALI